MAEVLGQGTDINASSARSQLKRLFGFPIRPGGYWHEQPSDTRIALRAEKIAFVSHLRIMPEDSKAVWKRATERIDRNYTPRQEACARIWHPIYEYLIDSGLPEIRQHPDLRQRPLMPGMGTRFTETARNAAGVPRP
ncbi:MAG TPA: hypothetical protein VFQ68_13230 [Streptosporangiaceae bacterium]|nr:hypothetical protein [Streptosporangiaceae bacterium]